MSKLTPELLASIDYAAIERKVVAANLPASPHCEACNKVLEDTEVDIKGYASGHELGLCRKCASFVNTTEAIDYAESKGFKVHSKPVYSPAKSSNDGGEGYQEGDFDA